MRILKSLLFQLFTCTLICLCAEEKEPVSHLSLGGGYYDARAPYNGGLFQVEYKCAQYWYRYIRPQFCLITPKFNSFFVGAGLALELPVTENLYFTPNFSPGLYYRGGGINLGFPLEFRSALEFVYEFQNRVRLGFQYWHISNASLGSRNPGANAATLYIAFPLCLCVE